MQRVDVRGSLVVTGAVKHSMQGRELWDMRLGGRQDLEGCQGVGHTYPAGTGEPAELVCKHGCDGIWSAG